MGKLSCITNAKLKILHLFMYEIVDGELAIVYGDTAIHIFERGDFSRAAYTYMIDWVQKNTSPNDDPDDTWARAEKAWDALSPETQGLLFTIALKEQQQARDIRDGLLATLHGYQGLKKIKDLFADAIQACFNQV